MGWSVTVSELILKFEDLSVDLGCSCDWRDGWNWTRIRLATRKRWVQHFSGIPKPCQTGCSGRRNRHVSFCAPLRAFGSLAVFTEAQHGVQTKTQAIDFSRADDPAWQQLADVLSPLDIGVLGRKPTLWHILLVMAQRS